MKTIKKWFSNSCVVISSLMISLSASAQVEIPEKDAVFGGFGDGPLLDQGLRLLAVLILVGIGLYLVGILFTTARTAMGTLEDVRYGKAEVKDMVAPILGGVVLMAIVVLLGYFVYAIFAGYGS